MQNEKGVDSKTTPERELGDLLSRKGQTIAVAESCTGGLVAHRLTNVSGSSAYYLGGFVAYANEAKEALLGVRHETLLKHGAVSEQTALEMARGARRRIGAEIGVSVTGIAGPTGGTPEKPVGLVYIGLAPEGVDLWEKHTWEGNRSENKDLSAEAALKLLLKYLTR